MNPAQRIDQIRVFLSSPGDVCEERALARMLLQNELPNDPLLADVVAIRTVSWDEPAAPTPMLASMTPQEAVNRFGPRPCECDIVIVVLWARLGSPLLNVRKPNGEPYLSGTEWEFENALHASPRPDILIYRRTEEPRLSVGDPHLDEKRRQIERVEAFFERFRNADGAFSGGISTYADPGEFKKRLTSDLRHLLKKRLEESTSIPRAHESASRAAMRYNVPALPPGYRPLGSTHKAVTSALINDSEGEHRTGDRLIGVFGMGGAGKTVVATGSLQDPQIAERFRDGIVWLRFGQRPNLADRQSELYRVLSGQSRSFSSTEEGRLELVRVIKGKNVLVVLDDLWEAEAVEAFSGFGQECAVLITTRDRGILTKSNAVEFEVPLLADRLARLFLCNAAGLAEDQMPTMADDILRMCGGLPLALAAIGGLVRESIYSWSDVLAALLSRSVADIVLDWLPGRTEPHVATVLALSIDALAEPARACFMDCVAFEADQIPEKALLRLWSERGITPLQQKRLARHLVDRSVLGRTEDGGYTLHDLYRGAIVAAGHDVEASEARLVASYEKACEGNWWSLEDDGYNFRHLLEHLAHVGRGELAVQLAHDFRWLDKQLAAAGVATITRNCEVLSSIGGSTDTLRSALALSSDTLDKYPAELASQLYGRLIDSEDTLIRSLIYSIERHTTAPWLQPLAATMLRPGHETLYTFSNVEEATGASVAIAPDQQRFAVTGTALTIRTLRTGREEEILHEPCQLLRWAPDGHTIVFTTTAGVGTYEVGSRKHRRFESLTSSSSVLALELSPSGWYVARSDLEGHVFVWSINSGKLIRSLQCGERVFAVRWLDDDRIAAPSWDGTIKIWKVSSGDELLALPTSDDEALDVWFSADRTVAVAHCAQYVERFDLISSQRTMVFQPTRERVIRSLAVDEQLGMGFVGLSSGEVVAFNLDSGNELWRTHEHTAWVEHLYLLPNGKGVSAGAELRVWHAHTGEILVAPAKFGSKVYSLSVDREAKLALTLVSGGAFGQLTSLDPTACGSDTQTRSTDQIWEIKEAASLVVWRRWGLLEASHAETLEPRWRKLLARGFTRWDLSLDGQWLAIATPGEDILLVNLIKSCPRALRIDADGDCERLIFDPKGNLLAAGFKESLRLWRTDDGAEIHRLAHPAASTHIELAFLNEGEQLAVVRALGCSIYDVATGSLTSSIKGVIGLQELDQNVIVLHKPRGLIEVWNGGGGWHCKHRLGGFECWSWGFDVAENSLIQARPSCVQAWSPFTGDLKWEVPVPFAHPLVAVGGAGTFAVWANYAKDRCVVVWNMRSGHSATMHFDEPVRVVHIQTVGRVLVADIAGNLHVLQRQNL